MFWKVNYFCLVSGKRFTHKKWILVCFFLVKFVRSKSVESCTMLYIPYLLDTIVSRCLMVDF